MDRKFMMTTTTGHKFLPTAPMANLGIRTAFSIRPTHFESI